MEFEITWVDPSLVICRTSGRASVEGYKELMLAMAADPLFGPGVDVITDHTNIDASALTAADIEELADLRARFTGAEVAHSAMVVGPSSPTRYGLGRMFEAYLDSHTGATIRIFETLEEAMSWLRGSEAEPNGRS